MVPVQWYFLCSIDHVLWQRRLQKSYGVLLLWIHTLHHRYFHFNYLSPEASFEYRCHLYFWKRAWEWDNESPFWGNYLFRHTCNSDTQHLFHTDVITYCIYLDLSNETCKEPFTKEGCSYSWYTRRTLCCIWNIYIPDLSHGTVDNLSMPDLKRPFRLGNKGNGLMWLMSILSIICIIFTIVVSIIPPSILKPSQYTGYIIYQIVATVLMIVIALVIYRYKKPEWKKDYNRP